MGDAERIMEMPRTQSYHEPRGPYCKSNILIDKHIVYSKIYCQGELLEAVQTANIFKDSKTFVDMSMKYSEGNVLSYSVKLLLICHAFK